MREAELHLPEGTVEAMGLGELLDAFRAAGVRELTELTCEGPGGVVAATVETPVDEALDDSDAVEWWQRLDDGDGERGDEGGGTPTYCFGLVAPGMPGDTPPLREVGVHRHATTVEDRGATLTVVGEQSSVRRTADLLRRAAADEEGDGATDEGNGNEATDDGGTGSGPPDRTAAGDGTADGADAAGAGAADAGGSDAPTPATGGPTLRRLGDYDGPRDTLDALTDRQREALETAHALGHYEVPREATVEEVADRLGLERSTVAEHLQRAERNVLNAVLGERGGADGRPS